MNDIVIITDLGSVDPDDIFSLLLSSKLDNINIKGIIATHHFPEKRAKLVKLMFNELNKKDIKVYKGNGIPWTIKYDESSYQKFHSENSKFPDFFGYPIGATLEGQRVWFPNFMRAYNEEYGTKCINNIKIEDMTGHEFLLKILGNYSPDNKLIVICLAPMHDLVDIPINLYKNMNIWAMGGGFEELNDDSINVVKAGYNWGICPEITQKVLDNLNKSNTTLNLVSSAIVRRLNVHIDIDIYNKWLHKYENDEISKLTKSIFKDWLYCNKGNKLTQHKNLCDPLTFMLAVSSFKYNTKRVNTTIDNIDNFTHYLQAKDDNLHMINMKYSDNGNTNLIVDFDINIINEIINLLEVLLF